MGFAGVQKVLPRPRPGQKPGPNPAGRVNPWQSLAPITALHQEDRQKTGIRFSIDDDTIVRLWNGYEADPWCDKLVSASKGMSKLCHKDGLWFLNDRLIIPAKCGVREQIFRLAHDMLGHFGFHKTYENIRNSYYWPGMRTDLEKGYIPSCVDCQRNKSSTKPPVGPLHPLPIPDGRCDSISMNFIGPLPTDESHDCILTITDRLGSEVRVIPMSINLTAHQLAVLFFDNWYCENGLPMDIISDCDKLFMAAFWRHLCLLAGIKHKAWSSFHPQSNG